MSLPSRRPGKDANLAHRILIQFVGNGNTWRTIDGIEDIMTNGVPDGSSVSTVMNNLRRAKLAEQTATRSGRSRENQPAHEHRLTSLGLLLAEQPSTVRMEALYAATQANSKGKSLKAKDEAYVAERERCDTRTGDMVNAAIQDVLVKYALS